MSDYTFTGAYPRVLSGLSQGVNASLTPVHGEPPVHGATLEAHPGDSVHTDEPYVHPELVEVEPAPEPPVVPIQLVAADAPPAPVDPAPADPAPDTMTAEGAPAPAPAA